MGRALGGRNPDYEVRRQYLLDGATEFVLREDVVSPSLRQIAIAVGASDPTVKHYFGTRTELVIDILKNVGARCEDWRKVLRKPFPSLTEALRDFGELSRSIPENRMLVQANLFALRESLTDPSIFGAYIDHVVEPNIEALAERLFNSSGGPTSHETARAAAGMIMSNIFAGSGARPKRALHASSTSCLLNLGGTAPAAGSSFITDGCTSEASRSSMHSHTAAATCAVISPCYLLVSFVRSRLRRASPAANEGRSKFQRFRETPGQRGVRVDTTLKKPIGRAPSDVNGWLRGTPIVNHMCVLFGLCASMRTSNLYHR